ncbi:DUF1651 domain-containing protein [Cyanobium sp. BA20m-p-22]|nr:DUF1651 domain-containing protein [Cyanobium sp. BA20m-p-22]
MARPNRRISSPRGGLLNPGSVLVKRAFEPLRYDRWSQALEVTFGEVMPSGEPPLLKHRRELMRNEAIKLWAQKRRAGWQVCSPQWTPSPLRRD